VDGWRGASRGERQPNDLDHLVRVRGHECVLGWPAMTQPSLFADVGVAPLSMGKGEHPVKVEIERRSRNKDRVLARLEAGPATNVELVAIGGMRAMARCWELKKEGKPITVERVEGGLWRVTLCTGENHEVLLGNGGETVVK
jgi:hypothetical protein